MACVTKRNGRYVIDCYDQYGQRYRKTLPKGTTKEEARGLLQEIEKKINRRTFLHEKKVPTFGEVAAEWLEYKKPNLRATTWNMYSYISRVHLAEFNERKITLINTRDVEKWVSKKQDEEKALESIRRFIVTMNQIMNFAVRHKLIDANPVQSAEKPRKTVDDDMKNQLRVLQPKQIRKLLEATDDEKYRLLFMTAIMTGMRQGELFGLKWEDVDFRKNQIHVKRSFNHGQFFSPKTSGSIRSIDMSPALSLELKKWKLVCGQNSMDLVFFNEAGNPMDSVNMMRRHFFPALKKAELPRIVFHDLRHTYASLLIAQGENIKYIQNQLGHATPTMTLDVYAHLLKPENPEAALRLERTIFEATGQNLVTK